MLSELGKEAQRLSELTSTDKLPERKMEEVMAKKVGEFVGVRTEIEPDGTIKFLTKNVKLKRALEIIIPELTAQAKKLKLDIAKKEVDPRLLTNLDSVNFIFKNNTTSTDDGTDIVKPGSYLFEELKKRGLLKDITYDPKKTDKDNNKDKDDNKGAPKVKKAKKPKTMDQLANELKKLNPASFKGKSLLLKLLKKERQSYLDKIKEFEKKNKLGTAKIFKERYSNIGFLNAIKERYKIRINPATINYFKDIFTNDPAFANPYKTN